MGEKYVAVILSLTTAFAYYVGWTYLYHYYNFLGIDILEINPPVQYTLIYSFPGLLHLVSPSGELFVFAFGAVIISAIGIVFCRCLFPSNLSYKQKTLWTINTLLFVLLLTEGYRAAKSIAHVDAANKWTKDSDPVFVEFKNSTNANEKPCADPTSPSDLFARQLLCLNSQLKLRLITSTQQFHYLFAATDGCPPSDHEICGGLLFKINISETKVTILQSKEAQP
jgi:hypothetical protein